MASERIDPRHYPGEPISLDHYARYAFAGQFARGKRVLDVACGLGYGADYLRAAGANRVIGVDISPDAIQIAREQYATDVLTFQVGDGHHVSEGVVGSWDVIASFETIEHLEDPQQFIAECSALLARTGVLVASVPNDAQDPEGANEFHIQRFNRASFERLLRTRFRFVEIMPQYFSLASYIDSGVNERVAELCTSGALSATTAPPPDSPECFVAVCANDRLPVGHQPVFVHARKFWEHHQSLLQGKSWLEDQLANWQGRAGELSAEVEQQRAQIEDVEKGKGWLEAERARWQQSSSDLTTELKRQQAQFEDQEKAKCWLEEERTKWEQTAKDLSSRLERQRAHIEELESSKRWLEKERARWEQKARERSAGL